MRRALSMKDWAVGLATLIGGLAAIGLALSALRWVVRVVLR